MRRFGSWKKHTQRRSDDCSTDDQQGCSRYDLFATLSFSSRRHNVRHRAIVQLQVQVAVITHLCITLYMLWFETTVANRMENQRGCWKESMKHAVDVARHRFESQLGRGRLTRLSANLLPTLMAWIRRYEVLRAMSSKRSPTMPPSQHNLSSC